MVARRVGVEVAAVIRDIQEKYNQFVVFYQTGKLAYYSSKIWEQYDTQFAITQRTEEMKRRAMKRAAGRCIFFVCFRRHQPSLSSLTVNIIVTIRLQHCVQGSTLGRPDQRSLEGSLRVYESWCLQPATLSISFRC